MHLESYIKLKRDDRKISYEHRAFESVDGGYISKKPVNLLKSKWHYVAYMKPKKKQFKRQRLAIFIKESYTSAYNYHDHNGRI